MTLQRITKINLEVIANAIPLQRLTSVQMETLATPASVKQRVSKVTMETLVSLATTVTTRRRAPTIAC